jgi:hypothetical protein
MTRRSLVVVALAILAVPAVAPASQAATSGTADVTLSASAHAMVDILDATLILTPNTTDYDNDYVEAVGASGLRVRVKTNSLTGLVLSVRCADAAPEIALADLLVKTATAAGAGGTTMSSYTAVTAANQTLWTTGASQHAWQTVATDVRVQNLVNYDAASAGTTDYTNTLTYSVVVQ